MGSDVSVGKNARAVQIGPALLSFIAAGLSRQNSELGFRFGLPVAL
jgi:hypothetical protein